MKPTSPIALAALLALALTAPLSGQTAAAGPAAPGEVADPPYVVGDLVREQGYTVEREEAPDLSFRIVDNRIRLYWIDDDGRIVEPEVDAATVRFTGSVRGRPYHRLTRLGEDTGLGSPMLVPPPHLYNVLLVIRWPDQEEPRTYSFRYTPEMDKAKEPAPDGGDRGAGALRSY